MYTPNFNEIQLKTSVSVTVEQLYMTQIMSVLKYQDDQTYFSFASLFSWQVIIRFQKHFNFYIIKINFIYQQASARFN